MFKNTVLININDPEQIKVLMYAFDWEDRDDFYLLLLEYVPTVIREIIPIDNSYEILWTDQKYYDQFLLDDRYKKIVSFLNSFNIDVIWS